MQNIQQIREHHNRVRYLGDKLQRYGELTYSEVKALHAELVRHGQVARHLTLRCRARGARQMGLSVPVCGEELCGCAMLTSPVPTWVYDDGGRKQAGYTRKSKRGDCVVRAIAIATLLGYERIRDELNERACRLLDVADHGIERDVYEPYLAELGWRWTPTMHIGSGCTVHLRADELPSGRIIASVSGHICAVLDGVIHDTYDPTRGGTRCVYGYYSRAFAG